MACAGEVNGEVVDLRTVIDKDCNLNILTFNDEGGRAAFHHTTSHIMAQAVKRLYPSTKLAIGPSIADGFYYDMDREEPFTAEELEKIEAEMKKIVKEDLKIEQFTLPREEAIQFMKDKEEPYKVEPVSYTHLDVYKRQDKLLRSVLTERKINEILEKIRQISEDGKGIF